MFGHTFRNLKRWNQILGVLIRYGNSGLLHQIGLGPMAGRILRKSKWTRHDAELMQLTTAARLRMAMEELGPTFIKLGQVLSTRRDIVPDDWATEFAKLQSDCPRVPFDEIRAQLESSFPGRVDELFSAINETPLAAASMAQAHAATLADGTDVVIKILRPNIRETIAGDMDALRFLARLVGEHMPNLGLDPNAAVEEFARELDRETDLTNEGRATERLSRMFEDDDKISFPKIYWNETTRDVLCETHVHGQLLADLDPSTLPEDERREIVSNGSRAVFHQTLDVGYFHADPHPGNIFVQPGGAIVFIDCGMTGFVDEETRMRIAELVYGVTKNDADMVMRAALGIADVDPDTIDIKAARAAVQELVGQFVDVPLERIDLGAVLDQFFQLLRRYNMQCPADIVLLIKAMSTIEGVAAEIDPGFDLVGFTRPYIEKLLKSRFSPKAIARRVRESSMQFLHLAEDFPVQLSSLFRRIRGNRLRMQMDVIGLEDLTGVVEHVIERLSYALLIASLVMASSILVLASKGSGLVFHLGVAGFVTSAALAFGLMFSGWRKRRQVNKRIRWLRKKRGE
ncbi:MAG: AarF/UbiB family protein [Phycisphaerales bacterium]|nr:AarF/UbiB family protein [Phycisphaerales bacterium]